MECGSESTAPEVAPACGGGHERASLDDLRLIKNDTLVTARVTFVTDTFARAVGTVDGLSVPCFIPKKHAHHRRDARLVDILKRGQNVEGMVVSVDQQFGNIVLDLAAPRRASFLDEKKPGDPLVGTVISTTSFGHFLDLGPLEALLHVSDIPNGTMVSIGQELNVWFLSLGPKGLKVTLKDPADSEKADKRNGNAGGANAARANAGRNQENGNRGDTKRGNGSPRQGQVRRQRRSSDAGEREPSFANRSGKQASAKGGERRYAVSDFAIDQNSGGKRTRANSGPTRLINWLVIPAKDGSVSGEPTLASVWPE